MNETTEPPPPPTVDVWGSHDDVSIYYHVHGPWKWVMDLLRSENMTEVTDPVDLPSRALMGTDEEETSDTPRPRRRRGPQRKRNSPSALKIDICDRVSGSLLHAFHGISAALEGLEDKDELVRTMSRCRCEEKLISPPSVLINWDVTQEECLNIVGRDLPVLEGNDLPEKYVVLKEPMGSQGQGIFFVKTAEEIHKVIEEQRQAAVKEPGFLDNLIAAKGRIPSWVLQAEVYPALLVKGRRKFHIRTYVVVLEKLHSDELFETYIFNRHEVRIAGEPVPENEDHRDRKSHITNGGESSKTERILLEDIEELEIRGLKDKLELFVATSFCRDLVRDVAGRIRMSADDSYGATCKFALAGLDLMVTDDNRIYLLEVNSNPIAPRKETLTDKFKEHLTGFWKEVVSLVTSNTAPNFVSAFDIMRRHGIQA